MATVGTINNKWNKVSTEENNAGWLYESRVSCEDSFWVLKFGSCSTFSNYLYDSVELWNYRVLHEVKKNSLCNCCTVIMFLCYNHFNFLWNFFWISENLLLIRYYVTRLIQSTTTVFSIRSSARKMKWMIGDLRMERNLKKRKLKEKKHFNKKMLTPRGQFGAGYSLSALFVFYSVFSSV